MNTPDTTLYKLYRDRERFMRELYLVDEKINSHLWNTYTLKKARDTYQGGAVIPGVTPSTVDGEDIDDYGRG